MGEDSATWKDFTAVVTSVNFLGVGKTPFETGGLNEPRNNSMKNGGKWGDFAIDELSLFLLYRAVNAILVEQVPGKLHLPK